MLFLGWYLFVGAFITILLHIYLPEEFEVDLGLGVTKGVIVGCSLFTILSYPLLLPFLFTDKLKRQLPGWFHKKVQSIIDEELRKRSGER